MGWIISSTTSTTRSPLEFGGKWKSGEHNLIHFQNFFGMVGFINRQNNHFIY